MHGLFLLAGCPLIVLSVSPQRTGRFSGFSWSFSTRWMALTRTLMSRCVGASRWLEWSRVTMISFHFSSFCSVQIQCLIRCACVWKGEGENSSQIPGKYPKLIYCNQQNFSPQFIMADNLLRHLPCQKKLCSFLAHLCQVFFSTYLK